MYNITKCLFQATLAIPKSSYMKIRHILYQNNEFVIPQLLNYNTNRNMSQTEPISLKQVLSELKSKAKNNESNIPDITVIRNKYRDNEVLTNELVNSLRKTFSLPVQNLIEKPVFVYNHLWQCNVCLNYPKTLNFSGVGISKSTAEYNSKVAALLWLSYFEKTDTNNNSNSITANRNRQCPFKVDVSFIQNILANGRRKDRSKKRSRHSVKLTSKSLLSQRFINIRNNTRAYSRISIPNILDDKKNEVYSGSRETTLPSTPELFPNPKYSQETKETSQSSTSGVQSTSLEEVNLLQKDFPNAKHSFDNIFSVLSQKLKDKKIQPAFTYKMEKIRNVKGRQAWNVSCEIKWPQNLTFTAKGSTKKHTANSVVLKALSYLKQQKVITLDGKINLDSLPKEVTVIKTPAKPVFSLSANEFEGIQFINRYFEDNMEAFVTKQLNEMSSNSDDVKILLKEPDDLNFRKQQTRFLDHRVFAAKEKVQLPITRFKNDFIELLDKNKVIIIKGEPGCGKSTRIPQYVLEACAKYGETLCRIAVTQPRRIAAISLAQRVASERTETIGDIVGYQVRLNAKFNPYSGRILYCTNGILLRQLQFDPEMSRYSHIIIDEAHERDINTDLLLNLLKKTLKKNPDLKLIVMSATIDMDLFHKYFEDAAVMEIPGFTHPVQKYFLDSKNFGVALPKTLKMAQTQNLNIFHEDVAKVIEHIHRTKKEGAILVFLPGWDDIIKVRNYLPRDSTSLTIHCLHSRLPDDEQSQIFSKPPPGVRKIILSTNIAETSVTIDDVVYVIDTGIKKDMVFDVAKGIDCIDKYWISKSSMKQRSGRAGRVRPGESYHLYPENVYKNFAEFSDPEILNTSLTKVILNTKALTNNMDAIEFMNQLLTPPERNAVHSAVDELKRLELLDENENLTPLGRTLAEFQLEPKLAKAMVNAVIFKCVTPVVDIVTLFSSETELFSSSLRDRESVASAKKEYSTSSDHLALMRIFEKWSTYNDSGDYYSVRRFCDLLGLIPHKFGTIEKLKTLHLGYLNDGLHDVLSMSDDHSDCDEMVKAALYTGIGNILEHRTWDIVKNKLKNNANVLFNRKNQRAVLASQSVNYKRSKYPSDYLMYINETRSNIRKTTIVRECSLISPISVLLFSNERLQITEIPVSQTTSNFSDKVYLNIENTKFSFICDKSQAEEIVQCKSALHKCYRYYIRELTQTGNDYDQKEFNDHWNTVLNKLVEIYRNVRID